MMSMGSAEGRLRWGSRARRLRVAERKGVAEMRGGLGCGGGAKSRGWWGGGFQVASGRGGPGGGGPRGMWVRGDVEGLVEARLHRRLRSMMIALAGEVMRVDVLSGDGRRRRS